MIMCNADVELLWVSIESVSCPGVEGLYTARCLSSDRLETGGQQSGWERSDTETRGGDQSNTTWSSASLYALVCTQAWLLPGEPYKLGGLLSDNAFYFQNKVHSAHLFICLNSFVM